MYLRSWFCLVFCLAVPAQAQRISLDSVSVADTAVRHVVKLRDGTTLVGRITFVSTDSIRLRLVQGEVSLARTGVAQVQQVPATSVRNGTYWFENPHATRLLFSSTAIPLEKGSGYYSNTLLALHTFAFGVTDRFTLGGGLAWFPGVQLDETFYYLLPKFTLVNGSGIKLAIGALAGLLPVSGDEVSSSAGIVYSVATTGNRNTNLSVGLGWGYSGSRIEGNPVLMVGAQARVNRRISLISENWVVPDTQTEGLYSYGLRFLGESLTVDLAFVSALGESGAFPWLGFAFRF